jgi:hypothetical protein
VFICCLHNSLPRGFTYFRFIVLTRNGILCVGSIDKFSHRSGIKGQFHRNRCACGPRPPRYPPSGSGGQKAAGARHARRVSIVRYFATGGSRTNAATARWNVLKPGTPTTSSEIRRDQPSGCGSGQLPSPSDDVRLARGLLPPKPSNMLGTRLTRCAGALPHQQRWL